MYFSLFRNWNSFIYETLWWYFLQKHNAAEHFFKLLSKVERHFWAFAKTAYQKFDEWGTKVQMKKVKNFWAVDKTFSLRWRFVFLYRNIGCIFILEIVPKCEIDTIRTGKVLLLAAFLFYRIYNHCEYCMLKTMHIINIDNNKIRFNPTMVTLKHYDHICILYGHKEPNIEEFEVTR